MNQKRSLIETRCSIVLCCFLFCLGAANHAKCQDEKEAYLISGAGISYTSLKDYGISRLTYSGSGIFSKLGFYRISEQGYGLFDIGLHYGNLWSENEHSSITNFRLDINYFHTRKVATITKHQINWFVGGSINGMFIFKEHRRFTNNAFNYESALSLSLANSFAKSVKLFSRDFKFDWHISIPVVSSLLRPAFASSAPAGFFDPEAATFSAVGRSIDFGSFHNMFRINSLLNMHYYLKNGNKITLGYNWDFYHIFNIPINKIYGGYQGFIITTAFNF